VGFYGDAFLRLTMLRPRCHASDRSMAPTRRHTCEDRADAVYGRCMRRARDGAWIEYVPLDCENQRGAIAASTNKMYTNRASLHVCEFGRAGVG